MMLRMFPRTPRMVVMSVIQPDTTTLVYTSMLERADSEETISGAEPHFDSTYSSRASVLKYFKNAYK